MTSATDLARKITSELVEHGVTDVVLSPGSRNAPLSIALYQAKQKGLLKLHIRIDERTASFFALGISKASGRPVALVCTSGTAPANYHPALLEARHSMVPLLAITADRPARLRETGANQTTLQATMFDNAVGASIDVAELGTDLSPVFDALSRGPAHLNVQFDEPLLADDASNWLEGVGESIRAQEEPVARGTLNITDSRGVLVIGHDHGGIDPSEISTFAAALGWPVVAEDPLSFPEAVAHSALFLASEKIRKVLHPEVVIVIGRSTLSRSTNAFVKSAGREIVIDPKIANVDRKRVADEIFTSLPTFTHNANVDSDWHQAWLRLSEKTATEIESLPTWSEPKIAQAISKYFPEDTTVYVASSRPVRDIEAFASPRAGVEVFANRGLAGIDGNISTALGIASQRKNTIAILGDLSFLHDLTGIIGAEQIDLRILVIDNNGGGIFSTLPQASVEGFEEIFGTPHGKDPAAIASAMGIPAVTVARVEDLIEKLSLPIRGLSVVVAKVPSREENAKHIKEIYSKIEKF